MQCIIMKKHILLLLLNNVLFDRNEKKKDLTCVRWWYLSSSMAKNQINPSILWSRSLWNDDKFYFMWWYLWKNFMQGSPNEPKKSKDTNLLEQNSSIYTIMENSIGLLIGSISTSSSRILEINIYFYYLIFSWVLKLPVGSWYCSTY